jgi:hypothetical protein
MVVGLDTFALVLETTLTELTLLSGQEQSHPTFRSTAYAEALNPNASTTWFKDPFTCKPPERQQKRFRTVMGASKQEVRPRRSKSCKCTTNFTPVG